jgi:hypothetical protein
MTFHWIVTFLALLAAAIAWSRARQTARRLEQLTQMYWELKFQHGELRVQVERLTGGGSRVPPAPDVAAAPGAAGESFVPLTSLKR